MRDEKAIGFIDDCDAGDCWRTGYKKGVTVEYQGKEDKTPLPYVSIKIAEVAVGSNEKGEFELFFATLHKGSKVPTQTGRVIKPGYIIFNEDTYNEWRISDDNTPFMLVLCKEEYFKKLKAIQEKSYKAEYEKALAYITQLLKDKKIDRQEYNKRLNEAYELNQNLLAQLDKHAETMARIDLSTLSNIEQQAIELTQKGQIDEAIALMKQLNLDKELRRVATKRNEGEDMVQKGTVIIGEAKEDLESLTAKIKTMINIYVTKGGKESIDESCRLYIELAEADTTNFVNVFECARFLHTQNQFSQSERYYQIALNLVRVLAQNDPDTYNRGLALTLNNLGLLHSDLNQYTLAEQEYKQALEIYQALAANNPDVYNIYVVNTLNILGGVHYNNNQHALAEQEYKQALEIYQTLSATNHDAYLSSMATSLYNLAILYSGNDEYIKSIPYYEDVVGLCDQLGAASVKSQCLGNLSYCYIFASEFTKAEQSANEALAIDPSQEWLKTNIVTSLLFQGRYDEAQKVAMEIKDKEWNGSKLGQSILDDLKTFEDAGVIPDKAKGDVEKMRLLLSK